MTTPTQEGKYKFKGVLMNNFVHVDFLDWFDAEVFLNQETKRLNAKVFMAGGDHCQDFVGNFKGEWK